MLMRVSMCCGKARTCRMWENCDSNRVFARITFPYNVGFRFSHCLMDLIRLSDLVFQFSSSMDASFSAEKKTPRILTTLFMGMSWILPFLCFPEPIQIPSDLCLFSFKPENSWNSSTVEISTFMSFSFFIVSVVSSANCFILVVWFWRLSGLFSFIWIPLISGLFLVFIVKISTATIKSRGLGGQPWRIPLSVGNQLDSQPAFCTQLLVPFITVLTNISKCGPKLKISRASAMHRLNDVSNALEKSKAISAPILFVLFRNFARSLNRLKWEAIFLPLTKPIYFGLR